ncbi:MAG: serine/threonine protein kinase [Phycisphaerales bacterium]|nr:serine/threonine protein kinase [Phycisphaerales bacterium]MCB9854197.1 serine/threonine protein kinase [Phycisphaerales bacterium]MCB9864274.1 serine/threonine protein kinase [Phycisphaerales bacterium]
MNPESSNEARRIFLAARALPPAQRSAFLDAECGDDADLRNSVEALLAGYEKADAERFLSDPTADTPFAPISSRILNPEPPTTSVDATRSPDAAPVREGPGAVIGQYTLLRRIGEGGFGSVFEAQQQSPVSRRVALKIIKLGMDTRQVIARFEAERQALAMMEHPNIAKVFDGGATETGRPYFVMELVQGEPITRYCDRNNLSIRSRLELFEQICIAVQHAHMKGIIHRDIKPSNVLVAMQDGKPVVKVIDFGIAKATNAELTERSFFTEQMQMIGTPQYMSPEQAAGDPDIDTRSDIYSLGVLLYELLTGTTPFDSHQLRSAAFAEIRRIICEVEPPKPSTRLVQTADTLASVAACRDIEPKRLGTIIQGELDWIVMKAMEKDRKRRYESATGFGADVRRYLTGEPVDAAPPSAVYRMRKFVRRHRQGVGVAIALGLTVLTAGSFGFQALQAEARADSATRSASAVKSLLKSSFMLSDSFESGSIDITVVDAMKLALDEIEAGKLDTQLELKAETLQVVATIYNRNLPGSDALHTAELALAARKAITRGDSRDLAFCMYLVGTNYQNGGRLDDAEALFRSALQMAQRLFPDGHPDVAEYLCDLALVKQEKGEFAEAEKGFEEAIPIYEKAYPDGHADLATAYKVFADYWADQSRVQNAEPLYVKALDMRRRINGPEHPSTVACMINYAYLRIDDNRAQQAEDDVQSSFDLCRRHPEWQDHLRGAAFRLYEYFSISVGRTDNLVKVVTADVDFQRSELAARKLSFASSNASDAFKLLSFRFPSASAAAVPLLRESLEIRTREFPDGHQSAWFKYNTMRLLGEAVLGSVGIFPPVPSSQPASQPAIALPPQSDGDDIRQAFNEAEKLLMDAWEGIKNDPNAPASTDADGDRKRDALAGVAFLYQAWNAFEPSEKHEQLAESWADTLKAYDAGVRNAAKE